MDPSITSHFHIHLFQRQMADYMTQIGHKSYQLVLEKFAGVFEALDNDIQHVDGSLDLDVVMED